MSAGNSFVWETGAPLVFKGLYDPCFTIGLQNKDLQLGYDMAVKHQVSIKDFIYFTGIERSSLRTIYDLGYMIRGNCALHFLSLNLTYNSS